MALQPQQRRFNRGLGINVGSAAPGLDTSAGSALSALAGASGGVPANVSPNSPLAGMNGGPSLAENLGRIPGDVRTAVDAVTSVPSQSAAPPPSARRTPQAPGLNGGEMPASASSAPAPPAMLQTPPPSTLRAPQDTPAPWRAPDLGNAVSQQVEALTAPRPVRGVYSDATTPQFSAANTAENGTPIPEGGGAGLSIVPSAATAPGTGMLPTGTQASAPARASAPSAGGGVPSGGGTAGELAGAFQQAVQQYQSLSSDQGPQASRARTQARNVMETLGALLGREIGADATVQSAGIGANARLGAAQIGADTSLQTAGMDNQTSMAQTLIDEQVQQRRNDIMSQWHMGRLGIMQDELALEQQAAQPSAIDQLRERVALVAAQEGSEAVDPMLWNMLSGEPLNQELVQLQPAAQPIGMNVGGVFQPGFAPRTELQLRQLGALRDQ